MKHILLVLGIMVLPMRASAQLVDTWFDNFRYKTARIRDRNIKFSSPRLEALQMSVAIEDEAAALDLDSWGDNRAWLGASKSNQIKIDAAFGNRKDLNGNSPMSYTGAGAYGRFGDFELEGMNRSLKADYTSYTETDKNSGIGAGWGHAFGSLLTGLHWNDNYRDLKWSDEPDIDNKRRYQFAGAAMAYKLGPAVLGGTMDWVDFGDAIGHKYGAQAVMDLDGFKAGLRASNMPLKEDWRDGADNYSQTVGIKELGARFSWIVPGLPLNLGAEYSNFYEDFETTSNGQKGDGYSDVSNAITAGSSLKLFENHVLIGAEYKYVKFDGVTFRYYTVGIEFHPIERLALRGSYQYAPQRWPDSEGDYIVKQYTVAGGVGYNFSKIFSVDIIGRQLKDINPHTATCNDGHLTFNARF